MQTWESGNIFEVPLSGGLLRAATEFLATPDFRPAISQYAATVMLVRDVDPSDSKNRPSGNTNSVEVFMLQRAATMAFVPNAVVFPGGKVDPRDADARLPWVGPYPSQWAKDMGCPEELARCIVVAAAREVFEECGILLAGPDANNVLDDMADPHWDQARRLLTDHTISFSEFLLEQKLVLRSDLLGLRSHWLTPEFEPRRYDTYFFAALLPQGQVPDGRTSEATSADWVDPQWVLDQANAEKLLVLPPTSYNLSFAAQANGVEEFVLEKPKLGRIMLAPWRNEDGAVVLRCVLP